MLQRHLSRILKVRSGEWRVVLLLQLQLFLIIAVLLIAKPAGNALFLSRYGSGALPYMFILTALVAGGVSLSFSAALRYHSILKVNLWSTVICLVLIFLFALGVPVLGARDIVAVGLYLWVALYGVVSASQFWLVANLIFDVRQAKRLFGFIGAGGIAGGIVGGYVANIVAKTYGFQPLLIFATVLLVPGIFITLYVWKKYIRGKIPKLARRRRKAELQSSPLRIILDSKHLSLLCGIVALSVVTAKLIDYQFSAMALKRFANEEHLTAFFGFWFSTFNVVGLLIQLLITQRVVKHLGISGSLLFLPAGLLLGAISMFIIPGLAIATFSRGVDGSLKQSLHRAGLEMLFLPVSQEVKERIKTYIDVFIDSAAGGLGGLLLLLLVDGLHFPTYWISGLVLILAGAWFLCVLWIREEYLQAFRSQLADLKPKQRRKSLKSKHKEVLGNFMKVLEDRQGKHDEEHLLFVLEKSAAVNNKEFRRPIAELLTHTSARVRTRAIRYLTISHQLEHRDEIAALLDDPNPEVMVAAIEYLISHYPQRFRQDIDERLHHPDPRISAPVFTTLVQESRRNDYIAMKWDIPGFFAGKLVELDLTPQEQHRTYWKKELLKACGLATFPQAREFLKQQLEAEDPDIRHTAIVAAGTSLDEQWLLRLIDFLSEAPDRPHARAALVQYGLGLVDILPEYLRNDEIDIEDIRRLPSVLEQIGQQETVNLILAMLVKYFPDDLEFRMEAIRSLGVLKRDFPELSLPAGPIYRQLLQEVKACQTTIDCEKNQLSLLKEEDSQRSEARTGLINLLQLRYRSSLERIFLLLGLRHRSEDIQQIYLALRTGDDRIRSNAIEFLDNLLDNSLKNLIIPIAEFKPGQSPSVMNDVTADQLDEQYRQFRRILRGRDLRMKISVLHLMAYLPEDRYTKVLEVYTKVDNLKLRGIARRGLDHHRNVLVG